MITKSIYFELHELVCPHVYKKYGEVAWQFFDSRLLTTLYRMRELMNDVITVNDWKTGGEYSQRGFRCIQCDLVKKAITEGTLYVSPHMTGQAIDFDVQGRMAEEVRKWIIEKKNIWPYPIRLEDGVNWCHMDTRDADDGKVYLFKA